MNLLWLESSIPATTMAAWVPQEARQYAVGHLFTLPVYVSFLSQGIRPFSVYIISTPHTATVCSEAGTKSNLEDQFAASHRWRVRRPLFLRRLTLIFHSGSSGSFGVPAGKDENHSSLSIDTLDAYALERWEVSCIAPPYAATRPDDTSDDPTLHGVLRHGPQSNEAFARRAVFTSAKRSHGERSVSILARMGFPVPTDSERLSRSGGSLQITSLGFQFLLHSPHAQLWELLLQYLHMVEVSRTPIPASLGAYVDMGHQERQMDLVEVLSFLFMLSTMELGRVSPGFFFFFCGCRTQGSQEYSVEHLSPTQTAMLEDLRDYGIIWQRKVSTSISHSIF